MTPNVSLSIPNALKRERPDDYYKNTATIEWPLGPYGEPFPIVGTVVSAVVFKGGSNVATAKEFVRFLVAEGWLAHYLDFSAERLLPAMSELLDQPFWLDPSDPHHMASVMQVSSRPLAHNYAAASGNWRHQLVNRSTSGRRRSTASSPRASAPSRRSTRRSPGSSRSWRSTARCSRLMHRVSSRRGARDLAPLGAKAADLVVWWEKGYYAQEDEALREIIAAFEQETGKQVELVFNEGELPDKIAAALEAGQPPDFAFGSDCRTTSRSGPSTIGWWTSRKPSATFRTCSIRMRSTGSTLLNAKTGQRALYGLPIGATTNHVHVWKSLLEQAGFTLADIPKEWEAFWSFWCDQVQPAVRRATGRDDIWGVGLPMSGEPPTLGLSSSSSWLPTKRTT